MENRQISHNEETGKVSAPVEKNSKRLGLYCWDSNTFDYLKDHLALLCGKIAEKYRLCDKFGKPRKAFILKSIMENSCVGCIEKTLTAHNYANVDAIYLENHKLAVNLLIDYLEQFLKKEGFMVAIEDEFETDYGRFDILISFIASGLLIKCNESQIIVEVKTGKSISYEQIFRYLIEKPDAPLIIWRVTMHQVIVINKDNIGKILLPYLDSIIHRAEKVLSNGKRRPCAHQSPFGKAFIIPNPQELLQDFASSLNESIPSVAETVLRVLRTFSE
jgi:hypothetical protein